MNLLKPDYGNFASLIPQQVAPSTTIRPNDYIGVSAILLEMGKKSDEAKKAAAEDALATQGLDALTTYLNQTKESERFRPRSPSVLEAETGIGPAPILQEGEEQKRVELVDLLPFASRLGEKNPIRSEIENVIRDDKVGKLTTQYESSGIPFPIARAAASSDVDGRGGVVSPLTNWAAMPIEQQQKINLENLRAENEKNKLMFGAMTDRELAELNARLDLRNQQAGIRTRAEEDRVTESVKPVSEKPITADQRMSATYAFRMNKADRRLSDLEASGFDPTTVEKIWNNPNWNNLVKDPQARQYIQAKRDFTNAVLRKESGAAIAPSEFKSAAMQYFPQIGDDRATRESKRDSRLASISGLFAAAGENAYNAVESEFNRRKVLTPSPSAPPALLNDAEYRVQMEKAAAKNSPTAIKWLKDNPK